MMMAPVAAFAAVFLGQLDAVAFNPIDRTDVHTVSPNYFHVLYNFSHQSPPTFRSLRQLDQRMCRFGLHGSFRRQSTKIAIAYSLGTGFGD
jgi:hypothetical protein